MKVVIITIAGVSSRFNEGISEENKRHKIIYYEKNKEHTLLYHMLTKCLFADKIILVCGYKHNEIRIYCEDLPQEMKDKIVTVYNKHYSDLGSGYSLYLGIKAVEEMFDNISEILFVEGDLDVDMDSFSNVIFSKKNVLTYCSEPIYANKAVILYKDANNHYRYAFNSEHGLLRIGDAFSLLLNSGQIWKFMDLGKLVCAANRFSTDGVNGTNLCIIQNYIEFCNSEDFELISLKRWTNCNTREDYRKIVSYWEGEG